MTKKIKLAIIAPIVESQNNIWNFTTNMCWNIQKQLEKYDDLEIVKRIKTKNNESINILSTDLNGADHILGLVLRHWSYYDSNTIKILKSKIPGGLFQYYDSGNRPEKTDINFALLEQNLTKRDVYMGWSADPNIFYPNKDKSELRILIDHSHFSSNNKNIDRSDEIARKCQSFKANKKLWGDKFKSVKLMRLVSGGIEEVDTNKTVNNDYSHNSVNQLKLAEEYSKAHIFIPTHQESLGLCILEAAMSGCYIVSPERFIKKTLVLDKVNHQEFTDNINWTDALNNLDENKNRNKVLKWDWNRSVDIIYKTIKAYDANKRN